MPNTGGIGGFNPDGDLFSDPSYSDLSFSTAWKNMKRKVVSSKEKTGKWEHVCGQPEHEAFILRIDSSMAQCIICEIKRGCPFSVFSKEENDAWIAREKRLGELRKTAEVLYLNEDVAVDFGGVNPAPGPLDDLDDLDDFDDEDADEEPTGN